MSFVRLKLYVLNSYTAAQGSPIQELPVPPTETDVGLGAIKRNSNGDFMAASARKKSFLGDVEIADAEAVLQCIKLATDSGFSPLIVESDSANKHAKVNK
ncbi:hypothetical protein WN944_000542 [Citrus x changshan-huyou]|uniref:RNase H type-1 domain-containing protein n=1 Tax=Citrus x changshan-huyou TaxID=2935761 RepID=A0AAP0MFM7_9ROSI